MVGRIIGQGKEACCVRHDVMCGASILTLGIPTEKGRYAALCARRAAKLFAKQKIRLAAFPKDYPYVSVFRKRGIESASETRLLRACAPQLALFALHRRGIEPKGASLALCAAEYSADAVNAAEKLARKVRFLALSMPLGEALAERLRYDCGISVRLFPAGERAACDAALCFDGAACDAGEVWTLSDASLSVGYRLPGGEKLDASAAALLFQCGALSAEELEIDSLSKTECSYRKVGTGENASINAAALLTKKAEKNMINYR